MGSHYAIAAQTVALGKLRPSTRRVLIAMAVRVLDKPSKGWPAGTYYWGYTRILGDLGVMPTKTSLRHLKANIAELVAQGLVQQTGTPHRGHRGQWVLHLPVDNLRGKSSPSSAQGP